MKIKLFNYLLLIFIILISIIIFLSTIGIETTKFNNQIKNKVVNIDKNLDLDLKKIKLTLDPFNFKINAKTVGATIYYSKIPLSLEYIKTQISFFSLIKNRIISSNLELATRSILLKDLVKFFRTRNNKPELFILESIITRGNVILELKLNFDKNGNIQNDYELNGVLNDGKINLLRNNFLQNINFNFNLKKDNYLFKEIKFTSNKVNFVSDLIRIKKNKEDNFILEGRIKNKKSKFDERFLKLFKLNVSNLDFSQVNFTSNNKFSLEIDKKFNFNNFVLNSDLIIDQLNYKIPNLVENYITDINETILLKEHKLKLYYKKNNLSIKGKGEIQFNKLSNEIEYLLNKNKDKLNFISEMSLKNINIKKIDTLEPFFPSINEKINLKDQKLKIEYENKIFSLSGNGKIKIDEEFEKINYLLSKKDSNYNFDLSLNLENTKFQIDQLNYKKTKKTNTKLEIAGNYEGSKNLKIKNFSILEGKNIIKIEDLKFGKNKLIKKIKKAKFDFIDNEKKYNQFTIQNINKNNYELNGLFFNANSYISNLLNQEKETEIKIFDNDINLNLNLKEVFIDEKYFVENLDGKIFISKYKVADANISANFKNNQNISFTIRTDKKGYKITTLSSSWAKPLVNRYKFIKGFEDGYLDFYSSKKNGISNSKLIIDNFKVKEIPALAKLLALSSLQGIADLLTGEGIRFTDFEMNFTNENKLMTINEIYAIGPSISILMEGYIEIDKLISLRGTLVPATTINRTIASIPLLGDLLIGKKIGEGVFGVSFKIKGPPNELETTVNPIKTLAPRFITRTLEKIKQN